MEKKEVFLFHGDEAKKIAKCTTREDYRYSLQNVVLKKNNKGGFDLFASNGRIMYKRSNAVKADEHEIKNDEIAIDASTLSRLHKTDMVYLVQGDDEVWFNVLSDKSGVIRIDPIKETHTPNFDELFPKEKQDDFIALDANLLSVIANAMGEKGFVKIKKSADANSPVWLETNDETVSALIMPVDTKYW